MTIREIIQSIVGDKFKTLYGIPCKVTAVDTGALTCDVEPVNGDADIKDVRLMAGVGNGVTLIPAVDSIVIVQMISDVSGYVTMYSQVQSIQLLDGTFQGLVKVVPLADDLNTIRDDINTLKSAISGWTPVPNDGGAALKTALTTWFGETLDPTDPAVLQNENITHGKP